MTKRDQCYLNLLLDAIRTCSSYQPKMGKKGSHGVDFATFKKLYQADPFYHWLGLDNPLMYAAHKAAGGMTSIYRQIGIGAEHLFRRILQDEFRLDPDQASWSYGITGANEKTRRLSLDARIDLGHVKDKERKKRMRRWLRKCAAILDIDDQIADKLRGVVFEVRQGYKSKDSKRQNADIANAAVAYTKAYLPSVAVFSTQIDEDIAYRYTMEKWLVLKGTPSEGSPFESTYSFMKSVIGYDLQAFFQRNSKTLRKETDAILKKLLSTEVSGNEKNRSRATRGPYP